jgi:hypothetical protein
LTVEHIRLAPPQVHSQYDKAEKTRTSSARNAGQSKDGTRVDEIISSADHDWKPWVPIPEPSYDRVSGSKILTNGVRAARSKKRAPLTAGSANFERYVICLVSEDAQACPKGNHARTVHVLSTATWVN